MIFHTHYLLLILLPKSVLLKVDLFHAFGKVVEEKRLFKMKCTAYCGFIIQLIQLSIKKHMKSYLSGWGLTITSNYTRF
jgi:hypothetical protein